MQKTNSSGGISRDNILFRFWKVEKKNSDRYMEGCIDQRLFEKWSKGLKVMHAMDLEKLKPINGDLQFNLKSFLTNKNDFTTEIMKHFFNNAKSRF